MSFDVRVPLDSDVWKIVRLHGIGLEQLDIYSRVKEGVHYLELRWKKHIFKEKRDAIASDLRAEGYNVRMTGKLSGLDDMKRELRERYKLAKLIKEIIGKPMTKEQEKFLNELRKKVKAKEMTVEEAKEEWNRKYKVWHHSVTEEKARKMIGLLSEHYGVPQPEVKVRDYYTDRGSYLITKPPEIRLKPEADLGDLLHEFGHHLIWVKEHRYWTRGTEERAKMEIEVWNWVEKEIGKWLDTWRRIS